MDDTPKKTRKMTSWLEDSPHDKMSPAEKEAQERSLGYIKKIVSQPAEVGETSN